MFWLSVSGYMRRGFTGQRTESPIKRTFVPLLMILSARIWRGVGLFCVLDISLEGSTSLVEGVWDGDGRGGVGDGGGGGVEDGDGVVPDTDVLPLPAGSVVGQAAGAAG